MTDYTDKCVALSTDDYKDDDRLVRALTAAHGLITVRMRGVKKQNAKLKPFAQPFCVFDARFVNAHGAFVTTVDPMLISDGFSVCADLKVFTAASLCAEATIASIGDDEPHTDVFLEFLRLLGALAPDCDAYYQAAVYMTRLLGFSGFYRDYPYAEVPLTPVQMLGRAARVGYDRHKDEDLSRRALKYISSEFERRFETGLKCKASIDLY